MSDMAKQARAAMKAKAKSLTTADPHQKVDSSTWTPAEPLNADIKTGMRPLSRRAFKAGGKVQGAKAKANLGKTTRGSNKPITPDTMANKDVKAANQDRPGLKHIGGLKTGGRACRDDGGRAPSASMREAAAAMNSAREAAMSRYPSASMREAQNSLGKESRESQKTYKKGGRTKKQAGGELTIEKIIESDKSVPAKNPGPMTKEEAGIKPGTTNRAGNAAAFDRQQQEYQRSLPQNRKAGGRAKKAAGGDLDIYGAGVAGAADMMKKAQSRAGVPGGLYGAGFQRAGAGRLSPMRGAGMAQLKKGGKAESHPDEKMDIALIKKMVKPSARTGKSEGGENSAPVPLPNPAPEQGWEVVSRDGVQFGPYKSLKSASRVADKKDNEYGGVAHTVRRIQRASGGNVFSGTSYPGKIPGVVPGGREARATGGKTRGKGKTNINIVIAAGKPAGQGDMMPPGGPTKPPGMDGGPGGVPVPVPPPQAGGMPGGMPMPMPMPMPAAPGGAPTPRKDGGRLTKVAKSYKDMEAGAGGGEGRLQKTDIAKKHKDAPAFRKGGKVYRSYKDMDAGAGSGLGRLEKTEIQARKG